ncbi:MAG TPA: hypothetical protein VFR24_17620, partial [Candidatus Angelobacter sp.]|nr:hypothetical protein [Candidatus Angelobacter sp.]
GAFQGHHMRFIVDAKDPGHIMDVLNADALFGYRARPRRILAAAHKQLSETALFSATHHP